MPPQRPRTAHRRATAFRRMRTTPGGLDPGATVAFDTDRQPSDDWMMAPAPRDAELTVQAVPESDRDWRETIRPRLGAPIRIGGHDTWYQEGTSEVPADPGAGSSFIVDAGSCVLYVRVRDRTRITAAELSTMVEQTSFGNCGDVTTWLPVLR